MFDGNISDWTDNQVELISWCRYYNAHYFSVDEDERPSKKVFKYNPLFDEFVDKKDTKRRKAAKKSKMQSSGKHSSQTWENN